MINKIRRPGRPTADAPAVSRDAVLRAVFKVFVEVGYAQATTRSLARAAGVSPALLNHLFGGKEGLWFEAVDAVCGPLHRRQMAALSAQRRQRATARADDIRQTLKTLLLGMMAEPGLLAFLYREGEQDNERGAYLRKVYLKPILDQLWRIYIGYGEGRSPARPHRATFEVLLLGVPRMLVFPQLVQERHALMRDSNGLLWVADQAMDVVFDALFQSWSGSGVND